MWLKYHRLGMHDDEVGLAGVMVATERGQAMLRESRYKILPAEAGRYQWDGKGDYTQWWYFDAEFDSGHRMMTIMLPRMFGEVDDHGNGPVPGITLVIMDPDGTNHHSHAYYPDQLKADPVRMQASFAADLFDVNGLLLRHEVTEYQESERTGRRDVPRRAAFSARLPHFKLEVEMDLFHELEAFRFTPFGDTTTMQPAWLQHIMNVRARGRWRGHLFDLEGEGVFETMLTGAK